jgi:hypothetical protein
LAGISRIEKIRNGTAKRKMEGKKDILQEIE